MAKKPARKPAQKKRGRRPKTARDWAPKFFGALREGQHVRDAARTAKVHCTTIYDRREADPAFRAAWDAARAIGTNELKAEARRRAYFGTLKPIFQGGKKVGTVIEYSDTLLMFLIKARDPRYRDNHRVELQPVAPKEVSVDRRARIRELIELAGGRVIEQSLELPSAPRESNGHHSNGHH